MMQKNRLVELTPDKWGLLVYLNEYDAVDLTTVKRVTLDGEGADVVTSCDRGKVIEN